MLDSSLQHVWMAERQTKSVPFELHPVSYPTATSITGENSPAMISPFGVHLPLTFLMEPGFDDC